MIAGAGVSITCATVPATNLGGHMTEDWPASRDWTIADIIANLLHPNGRPAFSTPTSGRSWVRRSEIPHHPTRRAGPRDARVYDRDTVLALWYKGHPIPKAAGSAASAPR